MLVDLVAEVDEHLDEWVVFEESSASLELGGEIERSRALV